MKYDNRFLSALRFAVRRGAQWRRWLAAVLVIAAASLAQFFHQPWSRRAQAAALQGEAAIQQLKADGGCVSLKAAFIGARQQLNIEPLLTPQQKLTAADGAAGGRFGVAVALSGDTAVIGAFADDVTGENQGSAYVFTRNGASWSLQKQLTANDGAANTRFGVSVAISGDTVVVGASFDLVIADGRQGAAYVFTRSGRLHAQRRGLDRATETHGQRWRGPG